jgi:hypothetical protein
MQATTFRMSLAACAALLSASHAPAQETTYGASGGDLLFGFSGSYRYAHASSPSGAADEAESFVARGNLSWFGSREHEFGLELAPGFFANELGGSSFDLYAGGYYNYNWWTSPQMTIYAGPQIGVLHTDPSGGDGETAFSYGAHAGLRFWIDPRVSIDIEPRLSFTSLDESLGGDEEVFDLLFGLSVKL